MDTDRIYEETMLSLYFNKLRNNRDNWNLNLPSPDDIGNPFINHIFGSQSEEYSHLVESSNRITKEMIDAVIIKLLEHYKVPIQQHLVEQTCPVAVYAEGFNAPMLLPPRNKAETVLVISAPESGGKTLFIFKKYGISNNLKSIEQKLCKAYNCTNFKYISYVEKNAFSEILNHNNDESDVARGTNIYSLQYFFNLFFDKNEYSKFTYYYERFTALVRNYYGLEIVSTLNPNALYSYKSILKESIILHPYESDMAAFTSIDKVSQSQFEYLKKKFISEKRYNILLGSQDYAQSFITADWLFNSFQKNYGNIDLAAISMGYYKALEQLLFTLLSLHTREKDHNNRTILIKGKIESLTNQFIEERRSDITLGTLSGFFRYYKNADLFDNKLDNDTISFVKEILLQVTDLRNGYFHKDNITEWEKVKADRNTAYLVCFTILSAFEFSKEEIRLLSGPREKDDYYKLCEYLYNSKPHSMLKRPVFFIPDLDEPHIPLFRELDPKLSFDQQGNPVFSGVYFRQIGPNGKHICFAKDNLPSKIIEGDFIISREKPDYSIGTTTQLIFSNGNFLK